MSKYNYPWLGQGRINKMEKAHNKESNKAIDLKWASHVETHIGAVDPQRACDVERWLKDQCPFYYSGMGKEYVDFLFCQGRVQHWSGEAEWYCLKK